MTKALLDDHLVRDLLAGDISDELRELLRDYEPATTNLYVYRLSRSVVAAAGGTLTGSWTAEQRRALGARLIEIPDDIEIVPMRLIAFSMAQISTPHRVSTLGAEAIAASLHLGAPLCVWEGDDGPGIRAAMSALGAAYRTMSR